MTSSVNIPGLRVLRGPDWDQSEADGGEGHLGTVVGVKAEDGTAEVVWDNGQVTTCRVGKEGKHDLRIYDNAAAGVSVSRGVVCQGCRNSSIYGTSWRCSTCSNLHLCSRCYHLGVHPLSHHFLRQDDLTQQGTAVGARSEATRVQVYGMFPEARVARGRDWQAGDVDGGPDGSGMVVEVVSPESGSARNAVRVSWDSGQSLQHRLGLHGKVDLVCTEEAPGPACYVSHLPVLTLEENSLPRLQTPTSTLGAEARQTTDTNLKADTNHATTQAGVQQNTNVTVDTKPEVKADANARGDTEIRVDTEARLGTGFIENTEGEIGVGDRVEVGVDLDTFRVIQTQVASWTRDMADCIGSVGVVKEVTGLGNVKVTFGDDTWILSPICLKKTTKSPTAAGRGRKERPKTGDRVRIISDVRLLEEQQRYHGGWSRNMAQAAGKVGTVLTINDKGDVVVQFGQRRWIFNPDSCTPAPGCSVDFIPAGSLDGLLEGLKRHLEDLPSDDAVLDAASSPRLRELLTAIKAGDSTKVAKLLDDNPGLVRETALESTALHYAALRDNVEAVRLLVAKGADINKGDKDDDTPLIRAVNRKRTEAARALIELGADVNLSNEKGRTPLHSAVITNSIDTVRLLLHNMASVNRIDIQGDTPLFDAMLLDNLDPAILDILLATGDLDLSVVNKRGFNALHMAALRGRPRAAERILQRNSSLLTSVAEEGSCTALHIASANNNPDVIKVLVKAKAPLDPRSRKLATPLHLACSEDHLMSARILVENGADINAVDEDWNTPLHECFGESKNLMTKLLGTSARTRDKGLELAKFLLQHGARHFLRNRQGKTALDVAPESVREKLTSFLSQPRETVPEKTRETPTTQGNSEQTPTNQATPIEDKCVTCHQRDADVIFLPCAHKLLCRQCVGNAMSCGKCGMDVKMKVDTQGKPLQQTPSQATSDSNIPAPGKEGKPLPQTPSQATGDSNIPAPEKGHNFKVMDAVRIIPDVRELERRQRDLGGWMDSMAMSAGKVGTVRAISPEGGLVVLFKQQYWIFNPRSCQPAPGCSPDFIPFHGLFRQMGIEPDKDKAAIDRLGHDLEKAMVESATFHMHPSVLLDLFNAVDSGHTSLVVQLVDREPGLINKTVNCAGVLHFASFLGNTEMVRILVAKGADISLGDASGNSCLTRCILSEHVDTARMLIQLGADVNHANKLGVTPLYVAVSKNNLDCVQLLLQNGASVNKQDVKGQTPLFIALAQDNTHPSVIEALLAVDDLNLKMTTDENATALHAAINFNKTSAIEKILARDSSLLHVAIKNRIMPLHMAARYNRVDAVRVLLKAGASPNVGTMKNRTPLHLTCVADHQASARLLVEGGADVNATDSDGDTPLHVCVGCYADAEQLRKDKGLELAKFLIQHGARPDLRNHRGRTPLEIAPSPVAEKLERFLREGGWMPKKNQNTDEINNESPPSPSSSLTAKCLTCHTRDADVIFLPCAHKLVCRECAGSTTNCRECGQDVVRKVDTKGNTVEPSPSTATASKEENAEAQVQECKVQ